MGIEYNLTLGMSREKLEMYSDLIEQGKLVDVATGGHYEVFFCGEVAIKCPYDREDGNYNEDAVRLLREATVQKDLECNGINVPSFLGYFSGNEWKRPLLLMETKIIKPAKGVRVMREYNEGMQKREDLGYRVNDTRFDTNHGMDKHGRSLFFDFTEDVHECWRLNYSENRKFSNPHYKRCSFGK